MKENIKKIMYNGGYAVIIAVVCMALYLGIMYSAQKCSGDSIKPVEIKIDNDGKLYLNYVYDDKDDLMILWETDAGTIKPESLSEELKEQDTENNKWYYAYTNIEDKLIWDNKDPDGREYEKATVRAILYEKTEDKSVYYVKESAVEVQITLEIKDDKVIKTDDRKFSNPVRKDSDENWSEIYLINEGEDGINTYRYRTGKDIPDDEYLFLRWEATDNILCETDIHKGLIPKCGILNSNKNKDMFVQVNTISIKTDELSDKEYEINAYIVNKDYYEQDVVQEKNKINKAVLKLSK